MWGCVHSMRVWVVREQLSSLLPRELSYLGSSTFIVEPAHWPWVIVLSMVTCGAGIMHLLPLPVFPPAAWSILTRPLVLKPPLHSSSYPPVSQPISGPGMSWVPFHDFVWSEAMETCPRGIMCASKRHNGFCYSCGRPPYLFWIVVSSLHKDAIYIFIQIRVL